MDTVARYPRREAPVTLRLHVRLRDAVPPVWRRVEVASDLGLDDLHEVLQAVFGWEDRHLYRFTSGTEHASGGVFACLDDLREAGDDDQVVPTSNVRVDELLGGVGERLYYQYDYGDNWRLTLEVEDVVDGRVPPGRAALVDGAGAEPPEDCGGVDGYQTMVAAADPAHPDHREALAELAGWWGRETTADEVTLVPFEPAAVADRIRALRLAERPPVPQHIGQELAGLLVRAGDRDTGRQLRALAAFADAPVDVDESSADRTMRPLRVLLDVVGDGVKLTAAGYLPPTVVRTLFDELDLADEWRGAGNREDLTVPVLELREAGRRLGLLRKHTGRLLPTARARTLAGDPVGLWWHVADRLPIGGRDATDASWHAGVLLLGLMASRTTDRAEVRIAELLTGLGWALEGHQPIDRRTATGLIAADVRLFRRLGALERDRHGEWPGQVTSDGITLARAALTDRRP